MTIDREAVEKLYKEYGDSRADHLSDARVRNLCRSWIEQADLILSQQRKLESGDAIVTERLVSQQRTIDELREALGDTVIWFDSVRDYAWHPKLIAANAKAVRERSGP